MRKALSVSISENVIQVVDYIARKTGLVRSRVVEALILYALKETGYEVDQDPSHLINMFKEVLSNEEN